MVIKCRACNRKNSKLVYVTKKIPEYIWPTSGFKTNKTSCKVFICKNCGHIQLQNFSYYKISKFYGNQTFVINKPHEMKLRRKKINSIFKNKFFDKKILEIGGGVNPLINKYKKDYIIVDTRIEKNVKEKFKNNSKALKFENFNGGNFDSVVLFHTLEHVKNPLRTVHKINKILKPGGSVFVEVPNFLYDIKFRPYYSIFHQHISMFSLDTLKNIFFSNGFRLRKIFSNKENIFVCFIKKEKKIKVKNFYIKNKIVLNSLKMKMEKINNYIKKYFKDDKFILLGAGGSSSLIIHNFPTFLNKIAFALDKDPRKKNLFIPSSKIKILSKNKSQNLKKINLVEYFRNYLLK